ncbi:RbsD or FucU transport [Isosphaera pallida ATCC 43644]|jgi:D-ribose pyranase|uniref:D-ribose pyranase n=1 Tax=Isosphaera pallida (strain ATCC 43644 / DSM 9630 / IS1B) TaxID=575540 RepID=E8QWG2_ISOPI|nr:D-ribose pyranase [Isosphaera pallida]ADV60849.1 RbsD or FucU transport [Isosphaera pallida ATCC 43644]
MKKRGILNPAICSLLAELGHQDELLIVDASFSLPTDAHVIDLSLIPNLPRFLDVFKAIAEELVIESVVVAHEIHDANPRLFHEIRRVIEPGVELEEVPHRELVEQAEDAKGIIRTGEFTPYANIRIVCGSAF